MKAMLSRVLIAGPSLLLSQSVFAAVEKEGVLNEVAARYLEASTTWGDVITGYAGWLFWTLAVISMVWTFGFMALRQADLGEFFSEFIRFTIFIGFFYWLLSNGPDMAMAIIRSLSIIGGEASGMGRSLSPSTPIDIAFDILAKAAKSYSYTSPIDNLSIFLITLAILACLAVVAANVLLAMLTAYILAYAGIFVLGFGGSKWTSDIALNYFRAVIGIGLKLMAMTLMIGIGVSILDGYHNSLSENATITELMVVFVVCLVLVILINTVPNVIAGLIPGGGSAGAAGSSFGAGALVGAAAGAGAMAAGGAGLATKGAMATSRGALGAGSAINAAVKQTNSNMAAGEGSFKGSSVGAGSGGSKTSSFAAAMNTGTNYMSDVVTNLGKGSASAAKEGINSRLDSARESLSGTAGGKIAEAIREQGASQTASEEPVDVPNSNHDEVNDFVNKGD